MKIKVEVTHEELEFMNTDEESLKENIVLDLENTGGDFGFYPGIEVLVEVVE